VTTRRAKPAIDYVWQINKVLKFKQYADYLQSLEDSDIYLPTP